MLDWSWIELTIYDYQSLSHSTPKRFIKIFLIWFTVDTTPPSILNCPSTVRSFTALHDVNVTWIEPFAMDVSGDVALSSKSHEPYNSFKIGATPVFYIFEDKAGNKAICNFTIFVTSTGKLVPFSGLPK